MNINKVLIGGRLTKTPELKALPNGSSAASFSVATNSSFKTKDGTKKETTEFHNIVVFGKQAESSAQYLEKGQEVFVQGRLQTRTWDKEDGSKAYKTEIVAEIVQFGQKPKNAPNSDAGVRYDNSDSQGPERAPVAKQTAKKADKIEYPTEDIDPEDIPF